MSQHRGSLVVDELVLPIVDIRLRGEAFVLTAHVRGPVRAVDGRSGYTVHDEGGAVVYRSTGPHPGFSWPALKAGSELYVTANIDVIGKTSGPATRTPPRKVGFG